MGAEGVGACVSTRHSSGTHAPRYSKVEQITGGPHVVINSSRAVVFVTFVTFPESHAAKKSAVQLVSFVVGAGVGAGPGVIVSESEADTPATRGGYV